MPSKDLLTCLARAHTGSDRKPICLNPKLSRHCPASLEGQEGEVAVREGEKLGEARRAGGCWARGAAGAADTGVDGRPHCR